MKLSWTSITYVNNYFFGILAHLFSLNSEFMSNEITGILEKETKNEQNPNLH